jgi:hypothetical protein
MRCEEARPLISAGLDEELEGTRAAQLLAHLTECTLCSTERESLAATVRLLRDLPEAEPPVELRRRIGVALLEAERAPERRWSGLAWLRRPHAPAWAWGAALGTAVAAVVVMAPRPETRVRHLVYAQNPTGSVGSHLPAPAASHSGQHQERKLTVATKPAASGFRQTHPAQTAGIPPVLPPTDSREATAPVQASPATVLPPPRHQRPVHSRPSHPLVVIRHGSPAAPLPVANAAPMPGSLPSGRRGHAADDSSRLARNAPPVSTDSSTSPAPDSDTQPDTSGMTQMASSKAMPPPQEPPDNDLVELRRRLDDRPLQIPELGQLKPATPARSNHEGLIRF